MAISATEIFRHHPECFEPATVKLFQEGRDPFALPGLHFTRETADSVAINGILQHNLGREDSSIVFVGYAAIGVMAHAAAGAHA
jgi:metallo-beta-lactamase family protein